MISVIQRVTSAEVVVESDSTGKIDCGILALVAVEKEDGEKQIRRMVERLLSYRIFPDQAGKMNLSLNDIQGGLLLVPQFTLAADTKKGTRPSFGPAATPLLAKQLFTGLLSEAKARYQWVEAGEFGADMKVSLLNDGPVTFILRV